MKEQSLVLSDVGTGHRLAVSFPGEGLQCMGVTKVKSLPKVSMAASFSSGTVAPVAHRQELLV